METSLDQLRTDVQAVVTKIAVHEALEQRLRDFGLVPGTVVCCRYRSPGGQVTALELRGTVVALRTRDLKRIGVRC
ncbi:MAG: FeoA domain-containing protein [Oscillospiraceae bacterium]|nr:FeoA domain-containing protein [Oscillospiraceae bacterium]